MFGSNIIVGPIKLNWLIEEKTACSPHTNFKLLFLNYSLKTMKGRRPVLYLSLNVFMLIGIASMSIIIASFNQKQGCWQEHLLSSKRFLHVKFLVWFSLTKHYCWTYVLFRVMLKRSDSLLPEMEPFQQDKAFRKPSP